MVPVVQVFKRDAPGDWWPEGADVFQLVWCPNSHWDAPAPHADVSPVIEVRWRRAADVTRVLAQPPKPVRHEDDGYGFSPRPCTLTPVHLTDFPYPDELPEEFPPAVRRLVEETDPEGDVITRVAGNKFGGGPTWHLTEPTEFRCRSCDAVLALLFTIASHSTTGITVGRWGDLRIFACPHDVGHGYWFDVH